MKNLRDRHLVIGSVTLEATEHARECGGFGEGNALRPNPAVGNARRTSVLKISTPGKGSPSLDARDSQATRAEFSTFWIALTGLMDSWGSDSEGVALG